VPRRRIVFEHKAQPGALRDILNRIELAVAWRSAKKDAEAVAKTMLNEYRKGETSGCSVPARAVAKLTDFHPKLRQAALQCFPCALP
jgi:hypothetical protein